MERRAGNVGLAAQAAPSLVSEVRLRADVTQPQVREIRPLIPKQRPYQVH